MKSKRTKAVDITLKVKKGSMGERDLYNMALPTQCRDLICREEKRLE